MFKKWLSMLVIVTFSISLLPSAYAQAAVSEDRLLEPDVIIAQAKAPYYNHFADIVNVPADAYLGSAPNGKLLVTYYKNTIHFPTSPSYPLGTIELVESEDNGRTWSAPREVISHETLLLHGIGTEESPAEARDPNLALLNDGTVLMTFWTSLPELDVMARKIKLFMMESADGGRTWMAPQEIHSEDLNKYAVKRGNIAVLEDDTILVPIYGEGSTEGSYVRLMRGVRAAPGNWIWIEEIDPFAGFGLSKQELDNINEVSLVYVGHDTVYAMARQTGHVLVSKDRGATWAIAAVQEPLHQPGLIAVDENRIFATWSRTIVPRFIYGKMVYLNEGLDWNSTDKQLLYTGGFSNRDMADPSAVLTNDNKLLTLYYDTRIRAIAGTFTDVSEWDIPRLSDQSPPYVLAADDMEAGEAQAAYNHPWFSVNAQGSSTIQIEEEQDNKYLSLSSVYDGGEQSVGITSLEDLAGDLSLTFDFRFAADVMPEGDHLGLSVAFSKEPGNNRLPLLIRPDALRQYNNGAIPKDRTKEFAAGVWYTAEIQRLGNRLYARTVPHGADLATAQWDYIYTSEDVRSTQGKLQLAFAAGPDGAARVDIDNLKLLGSYTFSITERAVTAYMGDRDFQLHLSFEPSLGSAPEAVWSSSNSQAVSVSDSGELRFLQEGSSVITATVGKLTDSIQVTVLPVPAELSGTGDSLIVFGDDFEGYAADLPYDNPKLPVTATASVYDSALVRSDGDNRYLQLSGQGLQTARGQMMLNFEDGTIGQPYPGTYGVQATVEKLEIDGGSSKAVLVRDVSTATLAEFRTQFTEPPIKRADIDFRMYLEKLKASNYAFIKIVHGLNPTAPDTVFWIFLEADKGTSYYDGSAYQSVPSEKKITTNKWHDIHIEVHSDDQVGEARLYIDGVYASTVKRLSKGGYGANGLNGISNINFLTAGAAAVNESFYIDDLKIAESEDHLTADYYKSIEGNYLAQYDFRFPADSQGTLKTSMLNKRSKNDLLVSRNGLILTDGGVVRQTAPMTLEASEWYSFKSARIGNSMFAKVWKKGETEPDTWDIVYRDKSSGENQTYFAMAYIPDSDTVDGVDIDNFTLAKSANLSISHERIVSMPDAEPVQLALSVQPAQTLPDIVWQSSDPDVATVDSNGRVSFHSFGTATITAVVGNLSVTSEIVVETPAAADYTKVDLAIGAVSLLNQADYTYGSWLYVQHAISAVVRGKLALAQAEVDGYARDINNAIQALTLVSMPHLNAAKQKASHLNKADYFADSWRVLEEALNLPETTNLEIVEKTAAILNAVNTLADVFPYDILLDPAQLQLSSDSAPVLLNVAFSRQLPVEPSVAWSSDNPEVASVDANGLLTINGSGATLVRVKTGESEAYCIVSVHAPVLSVTGVDLLQDLRVAQGVQLANLNLPDQVWITLGDSSRHQTSVSWDSGTPSYNPNVAGGYEFKGSLVLPNQVINPSGKFASVRVVVEAGNGGGSWWPADVPETVKEEVKEDDSAEVIPQPIKFADTAGHWAYLLIQQAAEKGMVEGYSDGTFQPDREITRAEFIVMLARVLNMGGNQGGGVPDFSDVEHIGSWAFEAIASAVQAGIVEGYEDGSFRPAATITRAEMVTMIARALGLDRAEPVEGSGFADEAAIPHWAKGAVASIRDVRLIEGRGDNRFDPEGKATRAEVVTLLLRMLEQQRGQG